MGNIITKDLLYIIYKILIPKFSVTCDNLKDANDCFGTSIKSPKLKTLRRPGEHVRVHIENFLAAILDHYKSSTIQANTMIAKNIIFLLLSPGTYSLEPQKLSLTRISVR